jgi:hypothetical protein
MHTQPNPAVLKEVFNTLEALAGFGSGRAALQRCGLATHLSRALDAGWLKGPLVGRARAVQDAVLDDRSGAARRGGGGGEGDGGGGWRQRAGLEEKAAVS